MDTTGFKPEQIKALRRIFKLVNYLMVGMWKLGMGRMINCWPAVLGRIMVIKHVGRKTGRVRLAPVNYAPVDGQIYCTAGFGTISDWYRNIMASPGVELWLPGGKVPARAQDISDCPQRLALLRQIIIASGFAAPLFGVNPNVADDKFAALTSSYRIIHFLQEQ
jgi:deazaflavin-dependent oxidoreductase (nitroreductase family)